jgi:hypothetical protein
MIRKLLISEQERQSILKSHGLLNEISGVDYLALSNYSTQKVLGLTLAVRTGGYNDISEFKKNCINTTQLGLSKKEKKNLLLNLNNQWDVLADKCMAAPNWSQEIDNAGTRKYIQTPNKVYIEYQKILENQKLEEDIKKILPTLPPNLKNLAQDYISSKDKKYCPNFNIEYIQNQIFRCDINNKNFGIFHQYDEKGNLYGHPLSTARIYNILRLKETLTYNSVKKINDFINSQSGGLLKFTSNYNTNGEIDLDFLNVKNYDDIKKLYEILENLSLKSDEIKSLAAYEIDDTKKWLNFLNETDNKKYCSNVDINFTGTQLNCTFDIAKTNELGKFNINWGIWKERINITQLRYTLTEEEKNQTTKEKIAAYFVKNIPKGFENMGAFLKPLFLKKDQDRLDFQSPLSTMVTFDSIKLFYDYIIKMEQGVKNKEYLKI